MSEKNKKTITITLIVVIAVALIWFLIISPLIEFKKSEKEVLNAGKRYFEVNSSHLPTGNRIRTIPLKVLYNKDFISEDIKVPNSSKICDENESWIKVQKKDNEYKYTVYLKCGIYSSRVDHKGPTITLKGEKEITINRGDKFKDPGIASVSDNTDGKIDVKNVKISSNVNTNKNGTYEIKYSVKDSFDNKSEVIRTVKVVQILDKIVKKETDKTNYYKGNEKNNYIKLDGILFNIVGLNEDGSVKITSSETLSFVDYNGLDTWLNDYFYNKLSDNVKKYIKTDSKWCNEVISSTDNYTKCNKYGKKNAVGLLSVADINNSKDKSGNSMLLNQQSFWLGNQIGNKAVKSVPILDEFDKLSKSKISGVRPTLNLKKNVTLSSGDGSQTSPYILKGNSNKLVQGNKISEARVGEYVEYSGNIWRISGVDKDKNTRIVLDGAVALNEEYLNLDFGSNDKYYSTKSKTNLGYKIVNDVSKYISTKLLANQTIQVYNYNGEANYLSKVDSKKYNAKLAEVSMFELFSASKNNIFWFKETDGKGNAYSNNSNDDVTRFEISDGSINMVRLSVLLDKKVTVKLGSGTYDKPYTITK